MHGVDNLSRLEYFFGIQYNTNMNYSEEIRKLRKASGNTQASMAMLTRMSRWRWNRIENGKEASIGLSTVINMISALRSTMIISKVERRHLLSLAGYGPFDDSYLDLLEGLQGKEFVPFGIVQQRTIQREKTPKALFEWTTQGNDERNFGSEIKKLRILTGQSGITLSKIAGISSSQWSRLETEKSKRPELETTLKMIAAIRSFKDISEEEKGVLLSMAGYGSIKRDIIEKLDFIISNFPYAKLPWRQFYHISALKDSKQKYRFIQILNLLDELIDDGSIDDESRNEIVKAIQKYLNDKLKKQPGETAYKETKSMGGMFESKLDSDPFKQPVTQRGISTNSQQHNDQELTPRREDK